MKISKIHFGAVIFAGSALFVFFALLAQVAMAGEISRHQRPDTALRTALDWCEAKGGRLTWAEKQPYILSEDVGVLTLSGNVLVFACEPRNQSSAPDWRITWGAPTARVNGQPLPASQIAGYQVTVSGKTDMVTGTGHTLRSTPRGTVVELRTVDTSTPPLLSAAAKITL